MKKATAAKRLLLVAALAALVVTPLLLFSGVLPYELYVVHTGSMEPTIPPKSAVLVRVGEYHLGQVISYRTDSGIVTHRLVATEGDELQTKGDANETVDPGAIGRSQVIGGVVAAPRMLGYWIVYFRQPAGLASLFLAVICAWLVYSLPMDVAGMRLGRGSNHSGRTLRELPRPIPAAVHGNPALPPTVQQDSLAFRCSGCGLQFASADELRAHVTSFPRAKTPLPERDPRWGFPVELLPDYGGRKT